MLSIRNQFQSCFVQIIRNEINAEEDRKSQIGRIEWTEWVDLPFFLFNYPVAALCLWFFFCPFFCHQINMKKKSNSSAKSMRWRAREATANKVRQIFEDSSLCAIVCVCVCVTKSSLNLTHFSWASWFGHLRLFDKQNSNS